MVMYKFVEERLSEDRVNFIMDKLRKDESSVKVIKTNLGWAVYSRPKDLKIKFFPKQVKPNPNEKLKFANFL